MIAGLNAIAGLESGGSAAGVSLAGTGFAGVGKADGAGAPFADLLTDAVADVSQLENHAQRAVQGMMDGSGVDVHRR